VASAVPWIANRPRSSSQSSAAPAAALIALSSETRRRKLARSLASGCGRRPRHCCGEGLSNCGEYELDGPSQVRDTMCCSPITDTACCHHTVLEGLLVGRGMQVDRPSHADPIRGIVRTSFHSTEAA
jgi:hypothetical protein